MWAAGKAQQQPPPLVEVEVEVGRGRAGRPSGSGAGALAEGKELPAPGGGAHTLQLYRMHTPSVEGWPAGVNFVRWVVMLRLHLVHGHMHIGIKGPVQGGLRPETSSFGTE